jgi:CRP-like cAMP-binding protein
MTVARPALIEFKPSEIVFREGDKGDDMFLIESGQIEILRELRGKEPIAILEAQDFFGEMAILEDQPRFATARAKTAVRLLRIDRAAFAGVLMSNVEVGVRIMRKLTARLRRSEGQLQAANAEIAGLKGLAPVADAANPAPKPARAASAVPAAAAKVASPSKRVEPLPMAAPIALKLVHTLSGAEFALNSGLHEMLVGRPDPVTGSAPEINLGLLDSSRTLSRRHAKLLHEGGLLFVREEVGASNGTFLNGERLRAGQLAPIKAGDQLKFGQIEIAVKAI